MDKKLCFFIKYRYILDRAWRKIMKYISKKGQHLQKHKRSFSKHTILEQCVALFLCFFMLVGFFPDIVQATATTPISDILVENSLSNTGKVTVDGEDYKLQAGEEYTLDNLTVIPNLTVSMKYTFEIASGKDIKKGDIFYFDVQQSILDTIKSEAKADFKIGTAVVGEIAASSTGVSLQFTAEDSSIYEDINNDGLQSAHANAEWAMRLDDSLVGSGNEVQFTLADTKFTLKFPDMSASPVNATKTGTLSDDKKIIDWTVTLTPNGNAQTGLIFEDTFADQTYVANSFTINENATTDSLDTSTEGTLKYTFTNVLNTLMNRMGK